MTWRAACLRKVVWQLGCRLWNTHQGAKDISLLQNVRIGYRVRAFSLPLLTRGSFFGIYRQWLVADHSSPSNGEVKNERS